MTMQHPITSVQVDVCSGPMAPDYAGWDTGKRSKRTACWWAKLAEPSLPSWKEVGR